MVQAEDLDKTTLTHSHKYDKMVIIHLKCLLFYSLLGGKAALHSTSMSL